MKRTDTYVATIDPKSEEDLVWLKETRETISKLNAFNKKFGFSKYWCSRDKKYKYSRIRVTVRGRLGKKNPAALKYSNYYIPNVKMEDAVRCDVYIHHVRD